MISKDIAAMALNRLGDIIAQVVHSAGRSLQLRHICASGWPGTPTVPSTASKRRACKQRGCERRDGVGSGFSNNAIWLSERKRVLGFLAIGCSHCACFKAANRVTEPHDKARMISSIDGTHPEPNRVLITGGHHTEPVVSSAVTGKGLAKVTL